MKKAKGLKKRWYMFRDLIGLHSKKYNYKNNYTKDLKIESFCEDYLNNIVFKAQKKDSDIMLKVFEKFPTKTWAPYGTERTFVCGVDAAPGVTETTLTLLYDELKNNPKNKKILSLGCGLRDGLKFLEFIGYDTFGVDFDVPKDKQTDKLKWHNLNTTDDLPFDEGFFDVVLCQEVIEHIENPWLLFRKVKRILKKGGIFLFTTPNINCREARLKFASNIYGYNIHFNPDMTWYHINPLPFFELKHIISYNNFSIKTISGNMDYFIEYMVNDNDGEFVNVLNRNDVCHYLLINNDNEIKPYIPKPTFR